MFQAGTLQFRAGQFRAMRLHVVQVGVGAFGFS